MQLADLWTNSIDAAEYCAYLWALLRRIAFTEDGRLYLWRADDDITYDPRYARWTLSDCDDIGWSPDDVDGDGALEHRLPAMVARLSRRRRSSSSESLGGSAAWDSAAGADGRSDEVATEVASRDAKTLQAAADDGSHGADEAKVHGRHSFLSAQWRSRDGGAPRSRSGRVASERASGIFRVTAGAVPFRRGAARLSERLSRASASGRGLPALGDVLRARRSRAGHAGHATAKARPWPRPDLQVPSAGLREIPQPLFGGYKAHEPSVMRTERQQLASSWSVGAPRARHGGQCTDMGQSTPPSSRPGQSYPTSTRSASVIPTSPALVGPAAPTEAVKRLDFGGWGGTSPAASTRATGDADGAMAESRAGPTRAPARFSPAQLGRRPAVWGRNCSARRLQGPRAHRGGRAVPPQRPPRARGDE